MSQGYGRVALVSAGSRGPLTETIILRRFGSAEEVADRVAFLVSDEGARLTGRVLEVRDGLFRLSVTFRPTGGRRRRGYALERNCAGGARNLPVRRSTR